MKQDIAEKIAHIGFQFSQDVNEILAKTAKEIIDLLVREEEFKEYPRKDMEDLAYTIIRQQLSAFLLKLETKKK